MAVAVGFGGDVRATGVPGLVTGFSFVRQRKERPFSDEDCTVVDLVMTASAALMIPPPKKLEHRALESAARWSLTRREREVLLLVVSGNSNKDIAAKLACSPRTAEIHVSAILRKSETQSRTQLAAAFWGAPHAEEWPGTDSRAGRSRHLGDPTYGRASPGRRT
jgi:DNA-binding CsgD family transcriptional regulator